MQMVHDEMLVNKARNGDRKAFNHLVNLWNNRIYNFTYKYFNDHDLAMEATQRTFIAVYKNLQKLEQPARFRSWLYRIASNNCHEEERRNKRRWTVSLFKSAQKAGEEAPPWGKYEKDTNRFANPDQQYQKTELEQVLHRALKELSEEQRIVVIMKEYEGLKFKEIAEALAISENTAKSRMYYGLNALRKVLNKWNINKETIHYES
ncbi:RNA polymerase sigma factor [Microscilla marina]|uniref:RNA polymerase ECF-type sigma factor n=1 Tax=Microscilla marina ATCC 23134 TaxID=313606 RepID=A1ZQJ0_MICM2|nr:sigma-70 family RNA polymerase sigma factor [Microscilla marina]EAY27362.1 RNA polymerase ECF-type sigma factor [Microscilla marina ATCC 23134]